MKKHKLLLVAGGLALAIVGSLAAWALVSIHHENVSKQLLLQEASRLSLPGECTEQYRTYQPGGVDTNSGWHIVYKCMSEPQTVEGVAVHGLKNRGYTAIGTANGGVSHFKNNYFQVDYDFIPDSPSSTTVSLTIYRAGKSY
ncbi:MAG TPA: hypothetical protein VGO07_05065 [Candidatus Saccharimonadales bacterium]|jgi:hypothetical protein|nr:hypothetical protein [Candidatus Saccharimonadales bacterium]